jgi:hypothetical protein
MPFGVLCHSSPAPVEGFGYYILYSDAVIMSSNAGCPLAIASLALLMAGMISSGFSTLSPYPPNAWAILA